MAERRGIERAPLAFRIVFAVLGVIIALGIAVGFFAILAIAFGFFSSLAS